MKDFTLGFCLATLMILLAHVLLGPVDDQVYRALRDCQGQLVGDK